MITPALSRQLHAIRERAIRPDGPKARAIMVEAFRQDPRLSARLLRGLPEGELRGAMAAAGLGKKQIGRALKGAHPVPDPSIEDPFTSDDPRLHQDSDRPGSRAKPRPPADDPADKLRAPVEDQALDFMEDILQGPKPFGLGVS